MQKIVRKCFRLFPKAVGVDSISILVIPGLTLIDSVTQVALRRRSTRLSRRALHSLHQWLMESGTTLECAQAMAMCVPGEKSKEQGLQEARFHS